MTGQWGGCCGHMINYTKYTKLIGGGEEGAGGPQNVLSYYVSILGLKLRDNLLW